VEIKRERRDREIELSDEKKREEKASDKKKEER
jgi:hypothetical protein